MDNLEIKQILQHLEKQEENINYVKNSLSSLLTKIGKKDTTEINRELLKLIRGFIHKHNTIKSQIVTASNSVEKIQLYFDGLLSNLPLSIKHHLVFRGKIKWQAFLLAAFLGFVITISAISYHNYKDTTDYEKAWKALIEVQSDNQQKEKLKTFLKEHTRD